MGISSSSRVIWLKRPCLNPKFANMPAMPISRAIRRIKRVFIPGEVARVHEAIQASNELVLGGDSPQAISSMRGILGTFPENVSLHIQLAKLLHDSDQCKEGLCLLHEYQEKYGHSKRVVCALMNRHMELWHPDEAAAIGERFVASSPFDQKVVLLLFRAWQACGGLGWAAEKLHEISEQYEMPIDSMVATAEMYASQGDLDSLESVLQKLKASNPTRYVKKEVERRWHRCCVLRTSRRILDSRAIQDMNGVVVLLDFASPLAQLWEVPLAAEMKARGFWPVILQRDGFPWEGSSGNSEIDSLQGMLSAHQTRTSGEKGKIQLRHEWEIDIEGSRIASSGVNIFVPVCARIGSYMRRHSIDWAHVRSQAILHSCIAKADAALSICEHIRDHVASPQLPVRFLSGMSHFPPAAVYKRFCDVHAGTASMEYVSFVAGYEHYYTNLGNKYSTKLSVANMTKFPMLNRPSCVTRESFESWQKSVSDDDAIMEQETQAKSIVHIDRARAVDNDEVDCVTRQIESHRESGGSVICIFGKIMYDVWMDVPDGPAHRGIVDWCNHTIECVKNSNTLLLIKPHPNEVKAHVYRPNEMFTDLISEPINKNTIVLRHNWFNMNQVVDMIDLGILWSGSSLLEMLALGVPAMVCSTWGMRDHPIQVLAPSSRENYRDMILRANEYCVSSDTRRDAAALLAYYATESVQVPHEFGVMPYQVGHGANDVRWYEDKVSSYISEGDRHIRDLADRVI